MEESVCWRLTDEHGGHRCLGHGLDGLLDDQGERACGSGRDGGGRFRHPVVIADHMRPGLSTVALPYHEMGSRAVKVLLDPQLSATAVTELISCPFVQRSSV